MRVSKSLEIVVYCCAVVKDSGKRVVRGSFRGRGEVETEVLEQWGISARDFCESFPFSLFRHDDFYFVIQLVIHRSSTFR